MRYCMLACWLVLGVPLCAQARVIWADDFSNYNDNTQPSLRFHLSTGNDYAISNTKTVRDVQHAVTYVFHKGYIENNDNWSKALTFSDNVRNAKTSATVTMDRFAPFDTSTSADRLMRIQFDMGVASFRGTTGLRFIIKPDNSSESNLIMGFGAANVIGGSSVEMFFFAANGGTSDVVIPTASHVIGLNAAGTAFEPGFDFGSYTSNDNDRNTSLPIHIENPFAPFLYHFDVTFDGTTYNGTVTRGTYSGEMTDDVATFSVVVPSVTLSNTDNRDRFIITTGTETETIAYVDNIEFSITPEPSGAVLLIGLAGVALRRRHALHG